MTSADDRPEEYHFPVAPAQARLLVLDRLHPDDPQYHVPAAFTVHGPFDVQAFTRALDTVVARHEALRTAFRVEDGAYVQAVAAEAHPEVQVHPGTPAGAVTEALLAEAVRPFDLGRAPLLRCTVHRVDDGSHCLLLTVHHLVCDGWSLQLVLQELAACYRAERDGTAADLEPLPVQYPDYAVWQRDRLARGGHADAVAHWAEQLRGAPATLALPTDRPRPAVQSTAGASRRFVLPPDLRDRLASTARARGTTPFAALFAAFNAFLSRITGLHDLVVAVPVSGRDHPDLQGMVGMLANTLALRTDLSGDPSFHELLDRVRDRLDASRPHQDAPFSAVVDAVAPERQLSHDPVAQVMFAYDDDTEPALELAGAEVRRLDLPLASAKFDLLLYVERSGPDLVAQFIHRTDLLDEATVRAWADSFRTLLDDLLARPERPIGEAALLGPDQRRRVLHDWNRTAAAAPDRLVPDLVAERAAERPEATALVAGGTRLGYRQLLARADRLAEGLREAGVGPEVPVGLCLPRGAEMAVAALAVLRAGGAYLPLDPEQPPARLRAMLADARARLVLAADGTAAGAQRLGVPVAVVAPAADGFTVPPPRGPGQRRGGRPGPRNTAYLLFTSGSTGTPKGVAVEHRSLTNMATAVRAHFPVTADDRVLQYVSFGFDVAVSDLFFAWVAGAELHIADERERLGDALHDRLRDSRISYVFLPPSAAMSLPVRPGSLPELRTLAVGGEPCPAELVERWAAPGRRLVDAYGPSEATVYATTAELTPRRPVVIGRPVANTRAYVLDRRLQPVPVGVVGEIYLAGAGLARGYANRPGLTAERFVADPYGLPGERMYRTGDLGRHDADGVLSYLGRTDTQVKVRGFRVELGEIETVLAGHPQVALAAARVLGSGGDRRLAAYAVPVEGAAPGVGELRAWLAEHLPAYMVPEAIVPLDALPLNRSGKVDRSRLPEPPSTRPRLAQPYAPPAGATQQRLAAVWGGVLEVDRIGAHDNFFELGGNSIRLLAVLAELRRLGGRYAELALVDLFRHPTVSALAAHLDRSAAPARGAARPAGDALRRGADRRERLAARARTRTPSEKGSTR